MAWGLRACLAANDSPALLFLHMYLEWVTFVCFLLQISVYRRIAGGDLCFLPVVNEPGALISCTKKKNESTLREPEKTVHLKILLNYGWYLGQGALKAGKCSLRPRQMWVCWRPHASVHPPYWKRHRGFLVRLTCSVRFDWHSVCFSAGKFLVSSVTAFIDSGEKSNPVKDNEAKNN